MSSDKNEIINKFVIPMHNFQKSNKITRMCVINSKFAYDIINLVFKNYNVKIASVCVLSKTNSYITTGHLVIVSPDGTILDPSYEIYTLPDVEYFTKYNRFKKRCQKLNIRLTKYNRKCYNNFKHTAKELNTYIIGELITDVNDYHMMKYYIEQADYVRDANL